MYEVQKEEQLVDLLGIKKYLIDEGEVDNDIFKGYESTIHVFRVDDVENLLKKLCNPANLTKITGALVMGKPLKLEDLLK